MNAIKIRSEAERRALAGDEPDGWEFRPLAGGGWAGWPGGGSDWRLAVQGETDVDALEKAWLVELGGGEEEDRDDER